MAENIGGVHLGGAVRDGSQAHNPVIDRWSKQYTENGHSIDPRVDRSPFKGVRREPPPSGRK